MLILHHNIMVNKELIYVNIYNEIELVDDLLIMKDPIVNNHILKKIFNYVSLKIIYIHSIPVVALGMVDVEYGGRIEAMIKVEIILYSNECFYFLMYYV